MAKRLIVTGRVQGVSYRASFETHARALQLSGWVRNRSDGSVEAVVAGTPAALERIIAWAWDGPAHAMVRHVEVTEADDGEIGDTVFTVRPSV